MWVQREAGALLGAHLLLGQAKCEVNYDDPLYSTGIIMGREELEKLGTLLGNQYQLNTDADLMRLVEGKGEKLVQELNRMSG